MTPWLELCEWNPQVTDMDSSDKLPVMRNFSALQKLLTYILYRKFSKFV